MQLICPKCNSRFELEQAVRELEQSEVQDIAAKFGAQWRLVYEYSDCFRQSEFGNVSLTKRLRIFKDIAQLLDALTFKLRGKRYRTTWPDVIKAMTDICNMNKWGVHNHNYLLTILMKNSERLSAEGLSAKEEQQREESRQYARHTDGGQAVGNKEGKLDFDRIATDERR